MVKLESIESEVKARHFRFIASGDLGSLIFWLFLSGVALALARTSAANGPDFEVYWKSLRFLWEGQPLYSVERDGIMPFKYPPWGAPAFLPFAWMPLSKAKLCWAIVEGLSFISVISWLRAQGISRVSIAVAVISFLSVLNVCAFNGQISLPVLAVSLWAGQGVVVTRGARQEVSRQLLVFVLSLKLVSLFPVLALRRSLLSRRAVALTVFIVTVLSLVTCMLSADSAWNVLRAWGAAMGPGLDPSSGEVLISIRGREAQGWVSALFRVFDIPAGDSTWSLALTVLAAGGALIYLRYQGRGLTFVERWSSWLAFGVTLQPLAGFHAFVFALPLGAVALDRALLPLFWRGERRQAAAVILGLLCVGGITSRTMGALGEFLEILSIKSIGVLVLAESLRRLRVAPGLHDLRKSPQNKAT